MNVLKYSILSGILWVLPSFILAYFNPALASPVSYMIFALLILYFLLEENKGPVLWVFIILGLSYYMLAGINYSGGLTNIEYFTMLIKYLIIVICGNVVLRNTTSFELYIFLLIGGASIVIHAIFFPLYNAGFSANYGRYSGFYINPNYAGAICLLGLSLGFSLKNLRVKYVGFLILTVGGFFTFSRYFLVIWLIINLASIVINRRNVLIPIIGTIGILLIFAFSSNLKLNSERLNAIESIFSGTTDTKTLQEDSRTDTWLSYKDIILNKPIFGNGYDKLQGNQFGLVAGVHNTYLLVLGEAGIFPFLILIGIYTFFLLRGYRSFKNSPHNSMLALTLITALLVTHNYFDKYSIILMSIYLYISFTEKTTQESRSDLNQHLQ